MLYWHEGDFVDLGLKIGADMIVFSANNVIKSDGSLVMGAGAAKRVRNAFPGIDKTLGKGILNSYNRGEDFEFVVVDYSDNLSLLGALQVKRDFREPANPELMKQSILNMILTTPINSVIVLNCSGIGLGGGLIFNRLLKGWKYTFNVLEHLKVPGFFVSRI